jgi:hypothetical protein
MLFQRGDLSSDLADLRQSRNIANRAVGDNFTFEERVSEARRSQFENHDPTLSTLRDLTVSYFESSVQGTLRNHIPSTFQSVNDLALYKPDIEGNQILVRLECLDDALDPGAGLSFAQIEEAATTNPRDEAVIDKALERFRTYRGARPAFVAFKSEVMDDLAASGWLLRLRNRLVSGISRRRRAREKPSR